LCLQGALYAFEAKDGKEKWKHEITANVASTPATDGTHVFFGCDSGVFYKLDIHTGKLVWSTKNSKDSSGHTVHAGNIRCPAAVHKEFVYFSAGDPDGTQSGEV